MNIIDYMLKFEMIAVSYPTKELWAIWEDRHAEMVFGYGC